MFAHRLLVFLGHEWICSKCLEGSGSNSDSETHVKKYNQTSGTNLSEESLWVISLEHPVGCISDLSCGFSTNHPGNTSALFF